MEYEPTLQSVPIALVHPFRNLELQ